MGEKTGENWKCNVACKEKPTKRNRKLQDTENLETKTGKISKFLSKYALTP